MTYYPPLGSYGAVATSGFFGWIIRFGTRSKYNHVFVYVGDGWVVEARPDKAGYARVTDYKKILWNAKEPIADDVRQRIVERAKALVGTKYGWIDIADSALESLDVRISWLTKRAIRSGRMDCSMLVKRDYAPDIDVDGPGDRVVTPGNLADRTNVNGWGVVA